MSIADERGDAETSDKRGLRWLRRPSVSAGVITAFICGIVFSVAFHVALDVSNTEAFCISCHEMRDNVYQEYKQTVHYKNPAGVRATCPDCHVPRSLFYKLGRKVLATNELLHAVTGTIDSPEKFRARRLALAQRVWATMKATDSRECRNCHAQMFMDLERQDKSAQRAHSFDALRESGKTCIDCHKGIAHNVPQGGEE